VRPDLIPLDQAIAAVVAASRPVGNEDVPLVEAAQRILSSDVASPFDLPPESASLMDGYAVKASAVQAGAVLSVGFVVPAGRPPERPLRSGECARVFTGGVIPDGADAVVKQEEVLITDEGIQFKAAVVAGEHVRSAGSDATRGTLLLTRGTTLDAGALSLIASVGIDRVTVARRPRVAILATGDELRRPGEARSSGAIFESNTVGLAEQARNAGAEPLVLGVAPDDADAIAARLKATPADIYVTSGGASVGDYDFARNVLEKLGGTRVFWQVAIRPGRPILFGTVGDSLLFALPGNPGASALTFDLLVRTAIRSILGAAPVRRSRVRARLTTAVTKPRGLEQLARGRCAVTESELSFEPAPLQGSMSIRSLAGLGAVAFLPAEATRVEAGALVDVELWVSP
jgi:molybdopterin molybdotransferase